MSIRTNIGRGIAALGVLAAVTSTAHADRRTGLAGNLLIEDKDDIYFFPQHTITYRNLISLDYGPTSTSGNALLTLGNADMAYGVSLHRGDILSPFAVNEMGALNDPPSLFAPPAFPAAGAGAVANITQVPATFVDLMLATGSIGFRAGIGRGLASTTDPATGDTAGESNTFIVGGFGWGTGTRGTDTRLDLGAGLRLDFGSATDAAGDDLASGTDFGLAGNVRAYSPVDATMDLGILGNVNFGTTSVTNAAAPMDNSSSALGLGLGGGVGPAFRFGPVQVAGYGVVQFNYSSYEPDSEGMDDETGTIAVVIPGVNLATEINLNEWFYVRTGAQYNWSLSDTSGPGDGGNAQQAGTFGWNAGLGVVVENFHFDGALQQGFVTGGPDFIGGGGAAGAGNGFFAIASLSYNFDKLRTGEQALPTVQPATESLEPAPVPEEPPPPALAPAPPPGEAAPTSAPAADPAANPEVGATGAASGSAGGSISVGTP